MSLETENKPIKWYRSPISRKQLAELNQRSDLKGTVQTLGHLGLLTLTGVCAWLTHTNEMWLLFAIALFLHGTIANFLLNGFHELCHKTVFKTKTLIPKTI